MNSPYWTSSSSIVIKILKKTSSSRLLASHKAYLFCPSTVTRFTPLHSDPTELYTRVWPGLTVVDPGNWSVVIVLCPHDPKLITWHTSLLPNFQTLPFDIKKTKASIILKTFCIALVWIATALEPHTAFRESFVPSQFWPSRYFHIGMHLIPTYSKKIAS